MNICMPARIVAYDFKIKKATVQPLINQTYNDGEVLPYPQIFNVPVVHPSSGGASITFPVKIGDKVTLIFSQKSLEEWLKDGNLVTPDDPRQNDLTDAIAFIGLNAFNVNSPVESADDLLIDYDGSQIVIHPEGILDINAEVINVTSPTVNIDAENVNVTGKVTAQEVEAIAMVKSATMEASTSITAPAAIINGTNFSAHKHIGVTSGPDETGGVA